MPLQTRRGPLNGGVPRLVAARGASSRSLSLKGALHCSAQHQNPATPPGIACHTTSPRVRASCSPRAMAHQPRPQLSLPAQEPRATPASVTIAVPFRHTRPIGTSASPKTKRTSSDIGGLMRRPSPPPPPPLPPPLAPSPRRRHVGNLKAANAAGMAAGCGARTICSVQDGKRVVQFDTRVSHVVTHRTTNLAH